MNALFDNRYLVVRVLLSVLEHERALEDVSCFSPIFNAFKVLLCRVSVICFNKEVVLRSLFFGLFFHPKYVRLSQEAKFRASLK